MSQVVLLSCDKGFSVHLRLKDQEGGDERCGKVQFNGAVQIIPLYFFSFPCHLPFMPFTITFSGDGMARLVCFCVVVYGYLSPFL